MASSFTTLGILPAALGPGGTGGGGGGTAVTRTQAWRLFGSSTPAGSHSDDHTDGNNNPVPSQFYTPIPIDAPTRVVQNTLPNAVATYYRNPFDTPGGALTVTNSAHAGESPSVIQGRFNTALGAGELAGVGVMFCMGINGGQPTFPQDVQYTISKSIIDACPSNAIYISTNTYGAMADTSTTETGNISNIRRLARRMQRYIQSTGRHDWAYVDWTWPMVTGVPVNGLTNGDVAFQRTFRSPNVFQGYSAGPDAHPNGQGYTQLGDALSQAVAALNGGPAFIPRMDLFYRGATAASYVGDLPYSGSLTGCTFASLDPSFSVAAVGSALRLSVTGAVPSADFTVLGVKVSKVPYADSTCYVNVSVSQRTLSSTAPVGTTIRDGVKITNQSYSLANGNTTKMSGVFVLSHSEDTGTLTKYTDGTVYNPIGGADARDQWIFNIPGVGSLYRKADGTVQLTIGATEGGNVGSQNSSRTRRIASGIYAIFFTLDTTLGNSGLYKMYISSIGAPGTGNFAAETVTLVHTTGANTIGLNGAVWNFFTNSADCIATTTAARHLQGTVYHALIYDDVIDFFDATNGPINRAKFFDEVNRVPVDLGNYSGTVNGITPIINLSGDAAELANGADDAPGATNGGLQVLNKGSAGNFLRFPNYPMGRMTTV